MARSPRLGASRRSSRDHCPSSITPAASHCRSSFRTRRSEIRCSTSDQKFRVIDAPEVVADVRVEHVIPTPRPRAPAASPVPVSRSASAESQTTRRRKSASKIGLQHERRRHLRHSVSDRRDSERPLTAIGFRNVSPQNRLRSIRAGAQGGAELLEHALDADCSTRPASPDRRPPRRGSVSPAATLPGGRHASRSGPSARGSGVRGSLGRDPESALQLAHVVGGQAPTGGVGSGLAGHALARPCVSDVITAGALPSCGVIRRGDRTVRRPPLTPAAPPRDFAIGLYAPRCPDLGRADGSLVFRPAPCTRAAPPTPPRSRCVYVSGRRHGRCCLHRDDTGSALGL